MRESRGRIASIIRNDPRILQRFWSCVDKNDGENGCWEWKGRCSYPGYPSFQVGQDSIPPSFVAWFSSTGEMPLGGRLHRTCENRLCVRPSHLAWIVSRLTERRLLAESEGYLALPGIPRCVDDRPPTWPQVVRVAAAS
jgi:hypothetical protein